MSVTRPRPQKPILHKSVEIKVLYTFNGPNAHQTIRLINEVARQLHITALINEIQVDTEELAIRYGFAGSPTVLVDGNDIEQLSSNPMAKLSFQTRMYGNSGVPPRQMIYDAIYRAVE